MLLYSILGITTGLAAHHGLFIRGEWHLKIAHIIFWHMACAISVFLFLFYNYGCCPQAGWGLVFLLVTYFSSLFMSITVYRLFFHAIRSFPGPKLAAVTKFWHIYQVRDSRNHSFMQRLHEKYGDFVRTGPNEITIFHPGSIQLLDGWGNQTTKDVWYDVLQPRRSLGFTRDELDHKERRKALMPSISIRCMDSYSSRIETLAQRLSKRISEYSGGTMQLDEVMSRFSFDAMGEVIFGQDFNLINSKNMHPAILHRDRALAMLGPIEGSIWLAHLGFLLIPFYGRVKSWFNLIKFCDDRMQMRMDQGSTPSKPDMASWFIKDYEKLRETGDIKSASLLLSGTVISAVVAGSDTTRASLIVTWWFLSKYPEHARKIQSEIQNVDVSNANALAILPHLNGVLSETLRLVPPIMTGNSRITGPEGLWVEDTFIPPFTKVTAPKYVLMRLESAFKYPDDFIPERWYSRPDLIRDKRPFAPFTIGSRQCLGKGIALTELRLVTAILLQRFDVQFAPGYDPDTMWRDMRDQVTAQPGQVVCIFKPRV